jgi:LysR family glycine cleavage system transcriptional activator
MANLRKDVSILRNLVTFEAAIRSQNFTRAAEELGMTRVAVSRQIADLEASIGKRLFRRNHRDVSLTEAGKTLASGVTPALVAISETLGQLRNEKADSRFSVTTTQAFATYWLMPRLVDFGARYPEIEINLVVSDRYLDLEAEGIDIAVRYTMTEAVSGKVTKLLREYIFPVYSPKYVPKTGLATANDLAQERLLHLSGIYRTEGRWPYWFKRHGVGAPAESGATVNTYINMLQAAIEGQGIALAGYPLVNRFLEDGSLRTIDGIAPMERDYFYLIDRSSNKPNAACFCDWIKAQAVIAER